MACPKQNGGLRKKLQFNGYNISLLSMQSKMVTCLEQFSEQIQSNIQNGELRKKMQFTGSEAATSAPFNVLKRIIPINSSIKYRSSKLPFYS